MALKSNLAMIFTDYLVIDSGIQMHFVCLDPGNGENSDYYVLITDAELAAVTTAVQLSALCKTKLQRQLRATGLSTKLDALIGQTITGV